MLKNKTNPNYEVIQQDRQQQLSGIKDGKEIFSF